MESRAWNKAILFICSQIYPYKSTNIRKSPCAARLICHFTLRCAVSVECLGVLETRIATQCLHNMLRLVFVFPLIYTCMHEAPSLRNILPPNQNLDNHLSFSWGRFSITSNAPPPPTTTITTATTCTRINHFAFQPLKLTPGRSRIRNDFLWPILVEDFQTRFAVYKMNPGGDSFELDIKRSIFCGKDVIEYRSLHYSPRRLVVEIGLCEWLRYCSIWSKMTRLDTEIGILTR